MCHNKNMIVQATSLLLLGMLAVAVPLTAEEDIPSVTLRGQPIALTGALPQVGSRAPLFELTDIDLSDVSLGDFEGQIKILSIVPSLDTSVCALSAIRFNEEVEKLENTVIVNISMDLPFANKRFCEESHTDNIRALSAFRAPHFGYAYGLRMKDGPMRGLLARAVIVLDARNVVRYVELVPDIAQEPDYEAALGVLRQL